MPKAITDRLGWCSVGDAASEEYIRTYQKLTSQVQSKVAKFMRGAMEKRLPDVAGEDYMLDKLMAFLKSRCPGNLEKEFEMEWIRTRKGLETFNASVEEAEVPKSVRKSRLSITRDRVCVFFLNMSSNPDASATVEYGWDLPFAEPATVWAEKPSGADVHNDHASRT